MPEVFRSRAHRAFARWHARFNRVWWRLTGRALPHWMRRTVRWTPATPDAE